MSESAELWGRETRLAIDNFPVSGLRLPAEFIRALAMIKSAAATANRALGHLDAKRADAIVAAAESLVSGDHADAFPVDVFQTGSGTSTHMNVNEVIATLATRQCGLHVHANDHVNIGQSSNDTIPSAIHVSAAIAIDQSLLPALGGLHTALQKRATEYADVIKTGRTHLMDAVPMTLGQEIGGWAAQLVENRRRLDSALPSLCRLAQGGTAVGTGINADPGFAADVCLSLAQRTGLPFRPSDNYFASIAAQDAVVAVSGQLRVVAVSLMKIANDLRWMNSGPLAGLSEIELPALQAGSSIMPGKVNPVVPESVCMVAAQVIGNDTTIGIAGQSGNFQLNVMLPVIAFNLLQSIEILGNACRILTDDVVERFQANTQRLSEQASRNPVLVTALNARIGYELGSKIAKAAYAQRRPVIDVAEEMTDIDRHELERLLDPLSMT